MEMSTLSYINLTGISVTWPESHQKFRNFRNPTGILPEFPEFPESGRNRWGSVNYCLISGGSTSALVLDTLHVIVIIWHHGTWSKPWKGLEYCRTTCTFVMVSIIRTRNSICSSFIVLYIVVYSHVCKIYKEYSPLQYTSVLFIWREL